MTRHGRNATNSAVYTYHERQKDSRNSGYGTEHARLAKVSLKGFDCCSLTLQPCKNAVVTAEGWLFDNEAILKYMLDKKKIYARKLKEFERQKTKEIEELRELANLEKATSVDRFEKKERNIMTTKTPKAPAAATSTSTPVGAHAAHLYTDVNARSSQASTSTSIKNTSGEKVAQLPAFWMPMLTPQSEATKLKKPDKTVYCPMTGKQIKMSHLFDVKFTEINDPDEKKSLIAREERYMCPVTHDILNNSTSCVVLKPTGDVVTEECVNNLIKKDMVHPLTGLSLKESDLIYLQRGGTGYAAANTGTLQAKHFRPSMAIA